MAKEKSTERKEKKRDKKETKRSESAGVHKSSKKIKKEKTVAIPDEEASAAEEEDVTMQIEETLAIVPTNEDLPKRAQIPIGALVPFANPLADEKVQKKVLKSVKKAAKNKTLKRGVKEVVKCLRKSPASNSTTESASHPGVVVLAADISPMDVISHIPVLCEDHGVPYIFVTSRAELGSAGSTKRPTSVVLVTPTRQTKKKAGAEETEKMKEEAAEYQKTYKELLKVVEKEGLNVRV